MPLKFICLCIGLLLAWRYTAAEIDPDMLEIVNDGFVRSGRFMLDFAVKYKDSVEGKLFSTLDKMSGFLGATGALLSLVMLFLPEEDSAELSYMKEKFTEVNFKLDEITQDLDDMNNLITLENQKAAYIKAATSILFGFQQMNVFLTEVTTADCSSEAECLRERLGIASSYVDDFDIGLSMFQILHGTVESISEFGEPLLDLIATTFKCDVGKITSFSNGVLKLAFKGQQVMLLHEKLTGSTKSVLSSMNSWLDSVYALRRKTSELQTECFENINTYMIADIKDTKYQTSYDSNKEAADAVKADMELKYPWLHWLVYALKFREDEGIRATENEAENFMNAPNEDSVKRIIIVNPQGKGLYLHQRAEFRTAIYEIFDPSDPIEKDDFKDDAATILNLIKAKLKEHGIWRSLRSFTLLRREEDEDNLQFAIDENHELYMFNREFEMNTFYETTTDTKEQMEFVRVLAVFKSREEIDSNGCELTCNDHGECKMFPFSSQSYCECEEYYQGENCEIDLDSRLALEIENLMTATFAIPNLVDVYFEINELGAFLGASIDSMADATKKLAKQIERSVNLLNEKITDEIRWANLITIYGETVTDMTFYRDHFPSLEPCECAIGTGNALDSMMTKVLKWIDDFNYLIFGRSDLLVEHESIMIMMMNTNKLYACTPEYKESIDNTWKQIVLLQNEAYMMLALLRNALGQPLDVVTEFQNTIDQQTQYISEATCQLDILHSNTLNCTGGPYLHPGLNIENTCQPNYFISGNMMANCLENQSECSPCNCNVAGSVGSECSDLSGQCNCKESYGGVKCELSHRDCQWDPWQPWTDCTPCGVGTQTRSHSVAVTKLGTGADCVGSATETRSCLLECCSGTFQCEDSCMSDSKLCDYFDDCGTSDEQNCVRATCEEHSHPDTEENWGSALFLAPQRVNFDGRYTSFIQMFTLKTGWYTLHYDYRECLLEFDLCPNRHTWWWTEYDADGGGNMLYLDRHNVDCGDHGFIGYFQMRQKGPTYQYIYTCCHVEETSRYYPKIICINGETPRTADGGGDVQYLDRQRVECPGNYYLSQFKLTRPVSDKTKIYYQYRCCSIQ